MNTPWTHLSHDERVAWHLGRWRRTLPAIIGLLAALALAAPMLAPAPVVPLLTLLCVIVWSLYQPRLMPPWAAFVIGVATDLALVLPLGVNATLMPLLVFILREWSPLLGKRRFFLDWLIVGPLIAAYQLLAFGLASLVGVPRDPTLLVGQILLSWALFPAIARAAAWMQQQIGFE